MARKTNNYSSRIFHKIKILVFYIHSVQVPTFSISKNLSKLCKFLNYFVLQIQNNFIFIRLEMFKIQKLFIKNLVLHIMTSR